MITLNVWLMHIVKKKKKWFLTCLCDISFTDADKKHSPVNFTEWNVQIAL